jgi:Nudix hydrolase domain
MHSRVRSCNTRTPDAHALTHTRAAIAAAAAAAGKVKVEDMADFATGLFSTVTLLRHQRRNAVWLKVPMDYALYMPIAGHYGFK